MFEPLFLEILRSNVNGIEKAKMYIRMREKFRSIAYKIKGETCYTIGYGHSNASVTKNDTMTLEKAEETLNSDF